MLLCHFPPGDKYRNNFRTILALPCPALPDFPTIALHPTLPIAEQSSRMEPVTSTVDLITILECIPTMLDCYVGEGMCELRNLRQVSKEARRVTTLAVRSFSLACLRQCLPINGVGKFLQQTRLQRLDVDIMFGGG